MDFQTILEKKPPVREVVEKLREFDRAFVVSYLADRLTQLMREEKAPGSDPALFFLLLARELPAAMYLCCILLHR